MNSVDAYPTIHDSNHCRACFKHKTENNNVLKKCINCRNAWYCNRECQIEDWAKHKKVCYIEKAMPIPGLRLFENFITPLSHDRFINIMREGTFNRNDGHFDEFKVENIQSLEDVFNPLVKDVFEKLLLLDYFSDEPRPLSLTHSIIKYKKNGYIGRHNDTYLLSGKTVIAISFNTPIVLNFYRKTEHIKIFVPPKSLYVMTGEVRDEWEHEILADETTYNDLPFTRGDRYALIITTPGKYSAVTMTLT